LVNDAESEVILETGPRSAVVRLSRPGTYNALSRSMIEELKSVVSELESLPDVLVVIWTGADGHFCSGADQKEAARDPSFEYGAWLATTVGSLLDRLAALPAVNIAAMPGISYGGGVEIGLACDYRVGEASSRFGLIYTDNGLCPGWGGTVRLARLVGAGRALTLLASGAVMSGPRALELGLLDEVTPEGSSLGRAQELAQQISAKPPPAVQAIIQAIRAAEKQPPARLKEFERQLFERLWTSRDHLEVLKARRER